MSNLLKFLEEEYILKMDCKLKFLLKQYSYKEIVSEIMTWILEKKSTYMDVTMFARDFYIGSDLTNFQRGKFYKELEWQGFFSLINNCLYDDDAHVCSWTIYTFGKFSVNDNAHFLERVYETHYKIHNPILAARCLGELGCLESKNTEGYVKALYNEDSLWSKLILLNHLETTCNDTEIHKLLAVNGLQQILLPDNFEINPDIDPYLWSFERFMFKYFIAQKTSKIDEKTFEELVKINFSTAKLNGY